MLMNSFRKTQILFLFATILLFSCEKFDQISDDPNLSLSFSVDTLIFDTVFTSVGSITKRFTVHNTHSKDLKISNIKLKGGEASSYRINIDGEATTNVDDVVIYSKDSLYIFARVLIDPTNSNASIIIEDEIQFTTNGNEQEIKLLAWGQDAHFIIADQKDDGKDFKNIAGPNEDIEWTNDKPYVIYGYAKIESSASLTIKKGTQIHFHNNSGLWIAKDAELNIEGELGSEVVFQGDRLDPDYSDITNQWNEIIIEGGNSSHTINYAIIKNGRSGIILNNEVGNCNLEISNSIVSNMSEYGVLCNNSNIEGFNNILSDCGASLLESNGNNSITFIHSTFANYWHHSLRAQESIIINGDNNTIVDVYFGNSIVDGSMIEELKISDNLNSSSQIIFNYTSLKTRKNANDILLYNEVILNPQDLFKELNVLVLLLTEGAAVIDAGTTDLSDHFPFDLLNNDRSIAPDLGAIEFIAE